MIYRYSIYSITVYIARDMQVNLKIYAWCIRLESHHNYAFISNWTHKELLKYMQ